LILILINCLVFIREGDELDAAKPSQAKPSVRYTQAKDIDILTVNELNDFSTCFPNKK
jgi:hypothetical protein